MEIHKYSIFIIYLYSGALVEERTFKIGLNRFIINKPPRGSGVNHATDWAPVEISKQQLISHIQSGFAISAHYKDDYRQSGNFICSDFIAADMDGTMDLDEALNTPFIQKFASFIYTTPSHTEDIHRFRVVFLLDDTITRANDWAHCLLGLAIRLGSDKSVGDAARLFYGSTNSQLIDLGHSLPIDEVDELIKLGRDEKQKFRKTQTGVAAIVSSVKLPRDTVVTLRNGQTAPLATLPANTSVHCPVHADKNPSAFVVVSSRGSKGVHCKTCVMSYWPDEGDAYDFDAFDNLVRERLAADEVAKVKQSEHPNPLLALFPPRPTVYEYQQQYLPPLSYRPGITVIKSPKGSGKTAALLNLVNQIRNKDISKDIPRKERPKTVLLIGHRRSLIREAANRLTLDCYLDDVTGAIGRAPLFGYAICLDSLPKIEGGYKYDTIIIDESEQVFSHLLAETIQTKRRGVDRVFESLQWLFWRAKSIYVLDADLGLITLHALKVLRPDLWGNGLDIVYNKPLEISDKRRMSIYVNRTHIQNMLIDAVRAGKRCFVPCNSRKMVQIIERMLRKEFGDELKMMAITSDNSQGEVESHFIENIQTEILKIQVLICSPSLGTGIDITFPDGKCEIDEVFGFFSPYVNKHTDIDQQLARVRNPGNVSVWFRSGKTMFETNTDVVREHLAKAFYVPSAVYRRLDENGHIRYNRDDPLLNVVTHVRVAHWASQNNIRALFEKLRKSTGWEIDHIAKPSSLPGESKWDDAEEDANERYINRVVGARKLNVIEYAELSQSERQGKRISPDSRAALERYRIEDFFQVPIERRHVSIYMRGALIEWIDNFSSAFGSTALFDMLVERVTDFLENGTPLWKSKSWAFGIYALISVGLINGREIDTRKRVSSEDFGAFIRMCQENRVIIQEVFNSSLRADFKKNPVRQFNEMIRCLGIELQGVGRRRINGVTRETYKFDPKHIKSMFEMKKLRDKQINSNMGNGFI